MEPGSGTWLRIVAPLVAAVVLCACVDDEVAPVPRIPHIPAPPPVAPADLEAAPATFRVTVRDLRYVTDTGVEMAVPRTVARVQLPPPAAEEDGPLIRASLVRLIEPRLTFPVDTIVTGINFFFDILEPRVVVDRLEIEDGAVGTLAHPTQYRGRWLWQMGDVDLVAEDVRLGGLDRAPERLTLQAVSGTGEVRGRPLAIDAARGTVQRTQRRLEFRAIVDLGLTEVAAGGWVTRRPGWAIDLTLDTLAFAELRAIVRPLPETGTGAARLRIRGADGRTRYILDRLTVAVGESRARLQGEYLAARTPALSDVVLDVVRMRGRDLEVLTGVETPVDGVWTGRVTADGGFRTGIRVDGRLTHRQPTGELSRLAVDGRVRLQPDVDLALDVRGDPLRAADTAFTATLRVAGPVDSLAIQGDVALVGPEEVVATLDARLTTLPGRPPQLAGAAVLRAGAGAPPADGIAAPARARAEARGRVVLAPDGAVDVRVYALSLPLAVLPAPEPVEDVAGVLTGEARMGGTVEAVRWEGTFRLAGAGFRVPAADLRVVGLSGPVRLDQRIVRLGPLTGRANQGPLRVQGTLTPFGEPPRVDLGLRAERVRFPAWGRVEARAAATAQLEGPLSAPRLSGRVVVRVPGAGPAEARATARGYAVLVEGGDLAVDVTADSLPLGLAPLPPEVDSVSGYVVGTARVAGTVDDPRVTGRFTVDDGAFRVRPLGVSFRDVEGRAVLEDDVVTLERVSARGAQGRAVLQGTVDLFDGSRLGLELELERLLVMDTEDAEIVASGELTLTGPFEQPLLGGRVRLVDGWAREDLFRPAGALDLESPPYAELARRIPWPRDSRLVRAGPPEPPPVRVDVALILTPDFSVVDDDSDLYGTGRLRVRTDEEGDFDARGAVQIRGGFYAFFGQRFRVVGGAAEFEGDGIEPDIAIVAEHETEAPLAGGLGTPGNVAERFPPLEFFAHGPATRPTEELRRPSLLPERKTELAQLLLFDVPPLPITGWRYPYFWRSSGAQEVFGERAQAQGIPLLWSYIADEAYNYLPLRLGYLQAGTIAVGGDYPARIIVGPLLQAAVFLNTRFKILVSQPFDGDMLPGVRGRMEVGDGGYVVVFHEPRFYAAPQAGRGFPGFFHRRRIGVGVGWEF